MMLSTDNMIMYTFHLTCFLALGHCCANLTVRQMPVSVLLNEGASINFSCILTYNVTSIQAVSVEWYRYSKKISYKRYNISGRQDITDVLTFHSVYRNQSGTYFCNVSTLIPCMERGSGTGTRLTVEVLTSPGTINESSSLTYAWTSPLAAVLAVGIGCVIYRTRKGNKKTVLTGQETDCPTSVPREVHYAKLNLTNSSTDDRSNCGKAQNCNKPHVGRSTLDSGCMTPTVGNVLYSTLKVAAPDL